MSNPDVIRADIERTREELGQDVDALADKVTPGKIVDRQKSRLRQRFAGVRERVMGVAEDVGDTTSHAASSAGDAVAQLPDKARRTAQGAPLVVGAVVAGIGFVTALLIPASDRERRMASQLREQAQPLVEKAGDAAREVAGGLKEPAKEAVEHVKDVAAESAEHVKGETQATFEHVKDDVAADAGATSGTPTSAQY